MNFDDIDVTKYLPKSKIIAYPVGPEKLHPGQASSSHMENPNLIQINFDAEDEGNFTEF